MDPGLEDVPGDFEVDEILDGGAELPESVGVEEEGFGEFGGGCELEQLVGNSAYEGFEGLETVVGLGWALEGVFLLGAVSYI